MDWPKITTNLMHAGLIFFSCYAAVNPKYAWAIPACQACGQMMGTPDFSIGAKK
jgi:hypothetical protein